MQLETKTVLQSIKPLAGFELMIFGSLEEYDAFEPRR
jgi:hypothetical protein